MNELQPLERGPTLIESLIVIIGHTLEWALIVLVVCLAVIVGFIAAIVQGIAAAQGHSTR